MKKINLIIFSGLPCSGKSTFALEIAKRLKYILLSVDPIESAMLKSGMKRNFKTGFAAYLVAELIALEQMKFGSSIVIDAVNPVKEARLIWQNLSKKFKANLIIIECISDISLHKKRINSRVRNMHGIPEVTWKRVIEIKKIYIPWKSKRLIIDSGKPKKDNILEILKYIKSFNH